jgi:N-acylneuraminate cytidylyltransferase
MNRLNKIKITGIIPVKGNSERVKRKNLRKFSNTSLYHLKLKQLKKTRNFEKFIVSSEDKKILKIAQDSGFEVHERDPYYSTKNVPMSEVYSYIASEINADYVAWINVTNPLVESKIYDAAVTKFRKIIKKHDCLLSAKINKENFFFRNKPINFKPTPWPRSQDLEPLISLPFAINILSRKNLEKWGSCVGKKPYFYFIDPVICTDIDEKHNFDFCEMIYKKKS